MNTFKENIENIWGQKGRDWLNSLPRIIEKLSMLWSLSGIRPVANMNYNYVALAYKENNLPVVLKISCDAQLILNEYKSLKHFDGHGTVRVLDFNAEYNAILLEQAIPGDSLKTNCLHDIDGTIKTYSQIVKNLYKQDLNDDDFVHVSQWCKVVDKISDQRIEKRFKDKAIQLKKYLLNSDRQEYVCHGDLHLENIIQHGNSWLAIDSKGIIGEMAFEAAAFDLINSDEIKANKNISALLSDRINKLAVALNLNHDRLLAWVFLRIIISAQWFIEDGGSPEKMLTLANYVYPLLQNCVIAQIHKQTNIRFEPASMNYKDIIFSWLNEPHIQEFWDNTQAHKDDILNFMEGRKIPSAYANGKYHYWIGFINETPYCMMMTIKEEPGKKRETIKNTYLSKTGSTYSLDFMIGNPAYFGKRLGAKTIEVFIEFFSQCIDPQADTFFIDPDVENPRAKHVYEKAGFEFIADFILEGSGCFSGRKTNFLVKKLNTKFQID